MKHNTCKCYSLCRPRTSISGYDIDKLVTLKIQYRNSITDMHQNLLTELTDKITLEYSTVC